LKMIRDWYQRLFLWRMGLSLRKGEEVEIPSGLFEVRNILVCLPEKLEDFAAARNLLPSLQRAFQKGGITVVLKEGYRNFFDEPSPFRFISINQNDITLLGFPKPNIVEQIKALNSDLAIDLNPDFRFLSAYLCGVSGARWRVSFVRKRGDHFFNLQIQACPEGDLKRSYHNLIGYLAELF